jgi:murein L,D-transpeptidase YafK
MCHRKAGHDVCVSSCCFHAEKPRLLRHRTAPGPLRFVAGMLILAGCVNFMSTCGRASETEQPSLRKADRIVVLKGERLLELLRGGVVLKTYPIAIGSVPIGAKRERGNGRTPEGLYRIDGRRGRSAYHLALHISYPSPKDRARAAERHTDPGGDIFIHGLPAWYGHADPSRFYKDWTQGCISVGNTAIEEIWVAVDDGTPVDIRP